MLLHFFCVQIKKKKKEKRKRSTYWPSQFWGQKGKQTFYCLGLMQDFSDRILLLLM